MLFGDIILNLLNVTIDIYTKNSQINYSYYFFLF